MRCFRLIACAVAMVLSQHALADTRTSLMTQQFRGIPMPVMDDTQLSCVPMSHPDGRDRIYLKLVDTFGIPNLRGQYRQAHFLLTADAPDCARLLASVRAAASSDGTILAEQDETLELDTFRNAGFCHGDLVSTTTVRLGDVVTFVEESRPMLGARPEAQFCPPP